MYFVNVNGKEQVTAHNKTLITFLRDELRLTGTKDAVNADWVLLDGVPTAARTVRLSDLEGKTVTTVEGINEEELPLLKSLYGGFYKFGDSRQFADDVNVPHQVYVRPIFGRPGARITKIDMSQALENVRFGDCILKADIPGEFDGMKGPGDLVESGDDVVALVVSTYLAELDALCRAIRVEYDRQTDAVSRPVPDLPECATAVYHDDDTLTLYSNGADAQSICRQCAAALDIPQSRIHCICTPLQQAKSGRAEVFAAMVAWMTQQSAKVKF